LRVLLVGETWISHATHVKGFDAFSSTTFHNGATHFLAAMQAEGLEVDQLAAHDVPDKMPRTLKELSQYSVVLISDIGANSLLLPNATWLEGQAQPNRLELLKQWVSNGGGLMMAGGYLSFQGINALGHYAGSAVEDVLPVNFSRYDDRIETPEGQVGKVVESDHPITKGLPDLTPDLLGHNQSTLKDNATQLMTIGGDPLLACGEFQAGRTLIWSSDIGPHWCPMPFIQSATYKTLLSRSLKWLGKEL